MAKKRAYTGGAESRRKRGMKAVVIPLTPEQHALVQRAAALTIPPGPAVSRWAAQALEAAASAAIDAAMRQSL